MKKVLIGILVFGILLCSVGCSLGSDFSELQGTWRYESFDYASRTIRIDGAQMYMRIGTTDEFQYGQEIIKENGEYYVYYSGGEKELISVSNDGKEITHNGKTYEKQ